MTAVITGSAGFIGHAVAQRLLDSGSAVIGLDSLNDYYDPSLKWARLAQLKGHKNFEFKRLDIADAETLTSVLLDKQPDYVIHLAAQAGVRYSIENPSAYVHSNLVGFANILEACRKLLPKHLVYASSSSVYGSADTVPFSTSDCADAPNSFYAATKRAGEHMAYSYSHLYGIPATGLRLFTVYGPWGRPDMAYYEFTRRILAGQPLHLYGNGKPSRDFTYIDDIVDGIVNTLHEAPQSSASAPHRLFNLGNDQPVTVIEVLRLLERLLGKKARVEHRELPPGDVPRTWADIRESNRLLGYRPKVRISEGLEQFVNWYRDYHRDRRRGWSKDSGSRIMPA